jgi:hypothetical protein
MDLAVDTKVTTLDSPGRINTSRSNPKRDFKGAVGDARAIDPVADTNASTTSSVSTQCTV